MPVNGVLVPLVHIGHRSHHMVGHDVVAMILVHGWAMVHVGPVGQRLHLPPERVVGALHGWVMRKLIVPLRHDRLRAVPQIGDNLGNRHDNIFAEETKHVQKKVLVVHPKIGKSLSVITIRCTQTESSGKAL
jgi:hypothetical protein